MFRKRQIDILHPSNKEATLTNLHKLRIFEAPKFKVGSIQIYSFHVRLLFFDLPITKISFALHTAMPKWFYCVNDSLLNVIWIACLKFIINMGTYALKKLKRRENWKTFFCALHKMMLMNSIKWDFVIRRLNLFKDVHLWILNSILYSLLSCFTYFVDFSNNLFVWCDLRLKVFWIV